MAHIIHLGEHWSSFLKFYNDLTPFMQDYIILDLDRETEDELLRKSLQFIRAWNHFYLHILQEDFMPLITQYILFNVPDEDEVSVEGLLKESMLRIEITKGNCSRLIKR